MTAPGSPTLLGERYELRGLIGRGGMAEVHRAFDRVLSRDVAVKMMHAGPTGPVERDRFASEIRVLARMNNPHLVMLLDAGVDEISEPPRPWLVMELVTGPTLAGLLADGPLEPGKVATIGAGLAEGLAHVHATGVVHRDVKPANVLLTSAGAAKLADFGVATMAGDQGELTQMGHTAGTLAYLAPEQVSGETLTGAGDVYALGLVLLEALTGRRAYAGSPTEAALARLHHGPAIPVSLGVGWTRVLEQMTARDPADRPCAVDLAGRLAHQRPVGSSPAALGQPTASMVVVTTAGLRHRAAIRVVCLGAAASILVLLAAGLAIWAGVGSGGPVPTPSDAAAHTAPDRGVSRLPTRTTTSPTTVTLVLAAVAARPVNDLKGQGQPRDSRRRRHQGLHRHHHHARHHRKRRWPRQ